MNREQLMSEADETLRAFGKLRDCPEFSGFYLSLVRRRRDAYDRDVLHDASLDPIERETRRRLGRELDAVLRLHEVEVQLAKREIEANR